MRPVAELCNAVDRVLRFWSPFSLIPKCLATELYLNLFRDSIYKKRQKYLIFVKFVIDEFIRSLFLEGDDDESDEDVDEEERKDDEVSHVEDGHLHAWVWLRTLILVRRVHGMYQHPVTRMQDQQVSKRKR